MGCVLGCHNVDNISDAYVGVTDGPPLKALPPHLLSPLDAMKVRITPNRVAGSKSATPVLSNDENLASQINSFVSPGNPFRNQWQYKTPQSATPEFTSPGCDHPRALAQRWGLGFELLQCVTTDM